MPITSAQELKVYALGSRRVVYAPAGHGEGLRAHLGSRGFPAEMAPQPVGSAFDRIELERHTDACAAQAALDDWPR